MMVSDIDIKDIAYRLVSVSPLKGMISGRVYKDGRPMNSGKEDIAIAVLAGDAAQSQEFALVINLFVPDGNLHNDSVESTKRLRLLCSECIKAFESVHFEKVWFHLESQRVMAVDDVDEHFISNKVIADVCCG